MLSSRGRLHVLSALILCALFPAFASAAVSGGTAATPASTLVLHQIGKGSAPLDGPWQFHLGDDPSWANPAIDDSTGHDGWEQLAVDAPWGTQGHSNTDGFGWYRRHISITPADGASPDVAMIIPTIDDVYEIYWNGALVGQLGKMPPHWVQYFGVAPQTYGLGPIRDGVLAIRVWKLPFASNEDGTAGGFEAVPTIGSPQAIGALKSARDFRWLRQKQFSFGLNSLWALVSVISFFAWIRNRSQWLFFWMFIFTALPAVDTLLNFGWHIDNAWMQLFFQTLIQIREVSQWFVLLWLLQLHDRVKLTRAVQLVATITISFGFVDGLLTFFYPLVLNKLQMEITDAVLTGFILPPELIPAILVAYAVYHRQKLDSVRWVVAITAFLNASIYAVYNISAQGLRFTHWTIADKIGKPLFTWNGNPFAAQLIIRTLLFLTIVYAVIRYALENSRRQNAMEQEFQNARELQKVLVPDTLPAIPGFTVTSAYRPALEVGGDFFQIIPIEGGSTLIILGDVSGKGLRAAMAVSLIVGTVRALADDYPAPAQLLTQLNRRLCGRLQGGFATCVILRLNPAKGATRDCTLSSAGHPAPFLNDQELSLAGALPLGLLPEALYEEATFSLQIGDHCALYTDGLLEARNPSGELYSFGRLKDLFATRPNAAQATEAAVAYGQDDDITVLTLTRLAQTQESTSIHSAPSLKLA